GWIMATCQYNPRVLSSGRNPHFRPDHPMSTFLHAARRTLAHLAFVVVVCVLLYAGLGPHSVPEMFHEEDKLFHLLGFAALAVCTRLAFPRRAWWWQALAMLALGAGIELAQNLQPA